MEEKAKEVRRFVGVNFDWSKWFAQLRPIQVQMRRRKWAEYNSDNFREFFPGRGLDLFEQKLADLVSSGLIVIVEPGLAQKAVNFSKAVGRDITRSRVRVSKDVRTERLDICRACDLYNVAKGTCKHPSCGCVMTRKAGWASGSCPIGKWGEWFAPDTSKD